MDRNAE